MKKLIPFVFCLAILPPPPAHAEECPKGQYYDDALGCTDCAVGTYADVAGTCTGFCSHPYPDTTLESNGCSDPNSPYCWRWADDSNKNLFAQPPEVKFTGNTADECPWVLTCGYDYYIDLKKTSTRDISQLKCTKCENEKHLDKIIITGKGDLNYEVKWRYEKSQEDTAKPVWELKTFFPPSYESTAPTCIKDKQDCDNVQELKNINLPSNCVNPQYYGQTGFDHVNRKWTFGDCRLKCSDLVTIKEYKLNQDQTVWEVDTSTPISCEQDYCKKGNDTECTQPAGYYRDKDDPTCKKCPMGTTSAADTSKYQTTDGATTHTGIETCYLLGGTLTGTGNDATCNGGTIFRDKNGVFCLPAGTKINIKKTIIDNEIN